MDCKGFDEELISYVLGVSSDEGRAAMDAHLLGCASCLRHFLETKRHVENVAPEPRPSPMVKERLRNELFPEHRASTPKRFFRSLARPVPFYQAAIVTLAIAAIAAIAPRFAIGQARTRAITRVDTSRKVPEAADIY